MSAIPVPTPGTTETFAIPVGAPSNPLKTRIIEIDEHSEKVGGLSQLVTYDKVMEATHSMTHGAIAGMLNWCEHQGNGTHPKWQFKRIFGKIPLPLFAFIDLFFLIYGVGAGWNPNLLVFGLIFFLLFLFGGAFLTTEYENDARDTCLICATGTKGHKFGKPIYVVDGNGRKRQVSKSGYCNECAWNMFRKNLWGAAEDSIWRLIQQHPVRERNILRLLGYKLIWWLGYQEECVDPRPVGRGQTYRKRDRSDPKDDIDVNQLDNIIKLSYTIGVLAHRAKKLRRKI